MSNWTWNKDKEVFISKSKRHQWGCAKFAKHANLLRRMLDASHNKCKRLEDELFEMKKRNRWIPEEEPPKECEEFLCKLEWKSGLITFIVARWHPNIEEWLDRHDTMRVRNVIEYQPLPRP